MKVRIIQNNEERIADKPACDYLKDWEQSSGKSVSFCLVQGCISQSDVLPTKVENEEGSVGVVPICVRHAAHQTWVELEIYAHIMVLSDSD